MSGKKCLERVTHQLISQEVRTRVGEIVKDPRQRERREKKTMEGRNCVVCAWRQLGVPGIWDELGHAGNEASQLGAAHACPVKELELNVVGSEEPWKS